MRDEIARCRRELAHLERLWREGHPDRHGIRLAASDWLLEESILLEEEKMGTISERYTDEEVEEVRETLIAQREAASRNPFTGSSREITFDNFCVAVRELLSNTAKAKGYNATGPEGPNMLFEFNARYFPGHALGEVIYKAVRFSEKKNLEDVLKAAAWLYLVWKHEMEVRG